MSSPVERQAQTDRNSADHWRTCPRCQESCDQHAFGCPACGAPLVDGYPASSRQRTFCRFCGGLTVYLDGVCLHHRDLIALDGVPPDPLTTLPTMAAQAREDTHPSKGTEA